MAKRLTAGKLEKLEIEANLLKSSGKAKPATFGIVNTDGKVVRKWRLGKNKPVKSTEKPSIFLPERLEKILWPKRLKIIFGGRGSGKTRSVVAYATEKARDKKERIACFREIQNSIADSSYQEIIDEINRRDLSEEYIAIENRIRHPGRRSLFTFDGLFRNITKVKGKAGSTMAWVEEAENVSRQSWDVLFPTIRTAGSEILVTFNPREEEDPTWSDLVAPYWDKAVDGIYEDDNILIIQCNHSHNPWLTKELILERDKMRKVDYDRYWWIWEGGFRKSSNVRVFNGKWRVDDFQPGKDWDGPYFGADFGFAEDPSTLVKCWVYNDRLWIESEAYGQHVELDDMPAFYDRIEGSRKYMIKADCSRPETISKIKKAGFRIKGAKKWPGSIEDGLTFLKSFDEIIINTRCTKTAYEFKVYSYKTDRLTGDILPDIVDKDNHCIDAIRYAMDGLIKSKGGGWYDF